MTPAQMKALKQMIAAKKKAERAAKTATLASPPRTEVLLTGYKSPFIQTNTSYKIPTVEFTPEDIAEMMANEDEDRKRMRLIAESEMTPEEEQEYHASKATEATDEEE